jgi:hypothetical protein
MVSPQTRWVPSRRKESRRNHEDDIGHEYNYDCRLIRVRVGLLREMTTESGTGLTFNSGDSTNVGNPDKIGRRSSVIGAATPLVRSENLL